MEKVISIVDGGFKFKSFGLSLGLVSGAGAKINVTYSLMMKGDRINGGRFTYSTKSVRAAKNAVTTGRHLLQQQPESLKAKISRKVLSTVIKYIKMKYPSIAPFLPKGSSCGKSGDKTVPSLVLVKLGMDVRGMF